VLFIDTLCVTGHRQDKLWVYDMNEKHYQALKEIIKSIIISYGVRRVYVGMALGIDQLFAQACVEIKLTGRPLELIAAIPCQNQECKWNKDSQNYYRYLLSMCDQKILVTDAPYKPYLMQIRNKFMVDNSDAVLAIWDGSSGGTGNCVGYAEDKIKPIIRIEPSKINVA